MPDHKTSRPGFKSWLGQVIWLKSFRCFLNPLRANAINSTLLDTDSVVFYTSGRQHPLKWVKGKRSRPMCPVVQQEEVESIPASSYESTIVHCVLRGTHFDIGRHARIPTRNTILQWVASFRTTGSTLKKKSPGRTRSAYTLTNVEPPQRSARNHAIALRLSEVTVRSRALRVLSLGPFEGRMEWNFRDGDTMTQYCDLLGSIALTLKLGAFPNPHRLTTLRFAAYPGFEQVTPLVPRPAPSVRRQLAFRECYGMITK
ncbi:hypothetical protein ANN_22154 [Periplaneta americana]|uniref:Uncharacterized protein n=1 Tax=Periplaneta americana TaxID=6978 RepID=A0ABQ8S7W2_PERAM|nr:hypothetical protein ANN_22154 [Periplaneta americana]